MLTSGSHINDNVRQKHNSDELMGTIWPAGWIQHCRHFYACCIGVGNEGGQGGASRGRVGGVLHVLLMMERGSQVF